MGTSENNSRGRIIVAHDNAMFAETLREFLTPTYEVVAVVGDGVALLRAADELKPNVAVVDTGLTLPNGKNASCQVKERYPAVKLVCVAQQGEPTMAVDAFHRGSSAFLVKSSSAAEFLTAIQEALLDRVYISPLIARKVVTELLDGQKQKDAEPRLTCRQREVLQLLAEGKSMKTIAETLGISARTVQFRVCVELLPGVVQASSEFRGNFSAASDPKIQIRIADGRRELLRSPESYDLITLEPPPPSAEGVANLYSTNFYALAARRLQPGGLLAQWLPLGTQNDQDSRALVRSFIDVFPYATLWSTEMHEMLLIGSLQPIELDAERISHRFQLPGVSAALQEVGIDSPSALLATWVTGRSGLEQYARNTPPVTDDRPSVEYSTWARPGEVAHVLPELLALRSEPPLQGASNDFAAAVATEGQHLRDFYEAGLAAYRGERELWARSIQRVLAEDGDNPYYQWTLHGAR